MGGERGGERGGSPVPGHVLEGTAVGGVGEAGLPQQGEVIRGGELLQGEHGLSGQHLDAPQDGLREGAHCCVGDEALTHTHTHTHIHKHTETHTQYSCIVHNFQSPSPTYIFFERYAFGILLLG